jgi:two-component system chemotaxis response regulator CheB
MEALAGGAFDFVTKPNTQRADAGLAHLRQELLVKIRHFMRHRRATMNRLPVIAPPLPAPRQCHVRPQAVLIAASTGGPWALRTMLPELCQSVELPILVVQHLPPPFTRSLADNLHRHCSHRVREAGEGDVVETRTVYIAPGGRHLLLRAVLGGRVITALNDRPPENGCRPSADVLFRSASVAYGEGAVAVVLTGMGADGSAGLGALKRAGAYVIAQDEASSVVWGMPGSAVASGHVDVVLPLDQIAAAIKTLAFSG